jgi:hypothetical protein
MSFALPKIHSYGNYASSNYGAHCLSVNMGNGLTLYFSYQTLVGFQGLTGRHVRENEWGPTTGKHLNAIDGGNKKARLSASDFERAWQTELTAHQAQPLDTRQAV